MGKKWDAFVPQPIFWKEVYRVLKHGGHVLCFFGTRTYDVGVLAMRLSGFEIRDCLQFLHGVGFPKGQNISMAIDKKLGAERAVIGVGKGHTGEQVKNKAGNFDDDNYEWKGEYNVTKSQSDEGKQWEGWSTQLKPANEPIVLARKPLQDGMSIAENVLANGTGGINIDACRIGHNEEQKFASRQQRSAGWNPDNCGFDSTQNNIASANPKGRFPANVILQHHEDCEPEDNCHENCPVRILNEQSGIRKSGAMKKPYEYINTGFSLGKPTGSTKSIHEANEGYASRFYYTSKASKKERNYGLPEGEVNKHPTVKSIAVMKWLIKLITPRGGKCCDPFMGSGTTGVAVEEDGYCEFYGIEMEEESFNIAQKRITFAEKEYADKLRQENDKTIQGGLF